MFPGIMSKKKKLKPIEPLRESLLLIGEGKRSIRLVTSWRAFAPSAELTRSEAFWKVKSSQSKEFMLKFMRLKFFWEECSTKETEAFFSHPEFLRDIEFNVLLALLATTELSRDEIVSRAEKALGIIGKKSFFRKILLPQWTHNIFLEMNLTYRPIGPRKAYSGWVRNASSVGSKKSRSLFIPEPIVEDFSEVEFDEYKFLFELISVGYIEAATSGIIRLP